MTPPFPTDDLTNIPSPRNGSDSVVGALTTLVDQQRGLVSGLLALADDAPSRGMRRTLRELAGRLETGAPLDEALLAGRSIPRPLAVAAEAGRKTGRLLPVLHEYQIASEELSRQRWILWGALVYPLVLTLSSFALIVFLFREILPQFRNIISDFGISIGPVLLFLFTLSDLLASPVTLGVLGILLGGVILFAVGLRFLPPLTRLFHWVPLLGTTLYWSGMSEFCRWMSVFVRAKAPLAPSFSSMGSLIGDPWIARCARLLAQRTAQGERLEDAADNVAGLPTPLRSICRWSRHGEAFPDMLERSALVFAEQARLQAEVLRTALVPILFVGVAGTVIVVMFAIMVPLFALLQALT